MIVSRARVVHLCTGAEEGACKGPRAKDVHFACPKPGLPNHSELLFLAFMVVDLIGIAMRSWSGLGCVLLCSP